ncbi:MAG: ATP-binding protein [bacterium]|nr:ATP-binding protein [bacterium]
MSVNWQKLRPWNGSQHSAFEELCCQLAAYESAPQSSAFIRKGAPDAGIECYWILLNGDEWGWQAKFFPFTPGRVQWQQLDNSVKTALDKHPRLTQLTICLPVDRQDPRIDEQQWFMDKWNESVEKWKKWAKAKGMSVEFLYWGEHEIIERLSREEHRGRHFFWFNEESFSQQWFEYHRDEAISDAGPRYTPELNVELPIARIFDGLGRTPVFFQRLKNLSNTIRKAFSIIQHQESKEWVRPENHALYESVPELLSRLEQIDHIEQERIDFESIEKWAKQAEQLARSCSEDLGHQKKAKSESSERQQKSTEHSRQKRRLEDIQEDFYALFSALYEFREFIGSHEARLSNLSALLLTGEAGTGKTHLFCDIAQQRIRDGLPTVLLLGGQFDNREPWTQISELLGISCKKDAFLGALEAAAQARGTKALLLIDALNEGDGKYLWQKHLAGMLKTLSRYPWIAFAISVRTTYETLVVPPGLVPERLIQHVHYGFAEYEYQAMRTFFEYFHLERPSIPLLLPEFQKPLFLKWFCLGLSNKGLTKVPKGLRGITAIFVFFIESVSEKLYRSGKLDFDPSSRIFQKAIESLAQLMADDGRKWLPRELAQATINAFLPTHGYENSLFRHMLTEGILAERRFPTGESNTWQDGIQFAYERFTDHLIARYLLDKHLNIEYPSDSFSPGQPLGELLKDQHSCLMNSGLIEAFSVQLPERTHKELAELIPHSNDCHTFRKAFVESVIWRKSDCFFNSAIDYVNKHVLQYNDTHTLFYNALLTIASYHDHPFNADFLHKTLMKYELAIRDAWWSIFLCHQYGKHSAVDRLVEWAWSEEDKTHIDDESIRLCCTALSWFLTTSHRYLRDKSTKALVALLTPRIHVLRDILAAFITVNDPYVLERLLAVAYGCALRGTDINALAELAQDIYDLIFKNGTPPPHILLRDYARGVIEYALLQGADLEINIEHVKPPYNSEWSFDIPTELELRKREVNKDLSDEEWQAKQYLFYSAMGEGDFARKIIGTDHAAFAWSSRRIGESLPQSRKESYEAFFASLKEDQKKIFIKYEVLRHYQYLDDEAKNKLSDHELSYRQLQEELERAEIELRERLEKDQILIFEELVNPYLKTHPMYGDEYRFQQFDSQIAQRWILNRVFELGWSAERFGQFDRWVQDDLYGHSETPERIGKKYQWIAYHEFLAQVSDNFEFQGNLDEHPAKYDGSWKIGVRDIDPSVVFQQTHRQFLEPYSHTWWFPTSYDFKAEEIDDASWLRRSDDLPGLNSLIEVTNPEDSSRWLALEAYYTWKQSPPSEEEKYTIPRREIWYMLRSYIVKKSDMNPLFEWATRQNFFGRWMPEWNEITHHVFLGEFFSMPAFQNIPYYPLQGWTHETKSGEPLPTNVVVTADQYMPEFSRDSSVSSGDIVKIYTPSKWLAENMGLHWDGVEGRFFDAQGKLIAYDPSVREPGVGVLLMNRKSFLEFLDDERYDVLWTILGEKLIHNKRSSPRLMEFSGAYRLLNGKLQGCTKLKPHEG